MRYAAAAAGTLLLAAGGFLVVHHGPGNSADPVRAPSSPVTHTGRLALERKPYIGVSCKRPNDFACDRVGLAVWLRPPAAAQLVATISGRRVALQLPCARSTNGRPCATFCREPEVRRSQPCGTYFEGFLRPAGLMEGPLKVKPDRGHARWIGTNAPVAIVRLVAHYRDGRTAQTKLRVSLSPGWG